MFRSVQVDHKPEADDELERVVLVGKVLNVSFENRGEKMSISLMEESLGLFARSYLSHFRRSAKRRQSAFISEFILKHRRMYSSSRSVILQVRREIEAKDCGRQCWFKDD